MAAEKKHDRPGERGTALVSVLWIMVLLALIAGAYGVSSRLHVLTAGAELETVRARWLAEGAVQRGLVDLLAPPEDSRIPRDGTPAVVTMGGATLTIRIFDETGKIDLNAAPRELLLSFLSARDLVDEEGMAPDPVALTDAILDWRDRNTVPLAAGAEEGRYRDLASPALPRNGPFPSILELGSVAGMTPALYDQLAPSMTTASRSRAVNPASASRAVLLGIPGITPAEAEAILRARITGGRLPPLPRAQLWVTNRQGPGFLIEGTAELATGARYRTGLIVWIEGYGVDVPIPFVLERRPGEWLDRED